jgi:hypothetical protein
MINGSVTGFLKRTKILSMETLWFIHTQEVSLMAYMPYKTTVALDSFSAMLWYVRSHQGKMMNSVLFLHDSAPIQKS